MTGVTSAARPVPRLASSGWRTLTSAGARLLAALQNFCEGTSWTPGRDWLTRVTDPGERQEPR
jgi:hypothetical protein